MQHICDLHVHSRYSRATSKDLNIEGLFNGARIKGIDLIGTGDFTFPAYMKEMEQLLEPQGGGIYRFKGSDNNNDPRFLITTEISNIYKRHGKVRRVHTCVWAPGLEEVKELNVQLDKIGNIKADGRPILGMDVADMAALIWNVSKDFIIIPAHAWTPWFAIFGSKSGFDSIEECFGDLTENIFAIETGLSSDPPMNWTLSQLDNISLVSNSDAHSLPNLGREATVMELEQLSIQHIKKALDKRHANAEHTAEHNTHSNHQNKDAVALLQNGDKHSNRIAYTIEFYPQEGKYHYDGHRDCKVVCSPEETKKHTGICPVCKRQLTLGVEYRVSELADRKTSKKNGEYKYIVPLQEIIADAFNQKKNTKRVQETYDRLIQSLGSEFDILLTLPIEQIASFGISEIAEGIRRVREGEIRVEPGYDGEYGVVQVFSPDEQLSAKQKQRSLF